MQGVAAGASGFHCVGTGQSARELEPTPL